jgi:hypothetical protein
MMINGKKYPSFNPQCFAIVSIKLKKTDHYQFNFLAFHSCQKCERQKNMNNFLEKTKTYHYYIKRMNSNWIVDKKRRIFWFYLIPLRSVSIRLIT